MERKIKKEIFLQDLPRWRFSKLKPDGEIDWKKSIGYKVKFTYDDIVGEVKIIHYDKKTRKLTIQYLNKKPFKIVTNSFSDCKLGKLLNKHTSEFRMKTGQRFKDEKRDIIIINKKYRERLDKNNNKYHERWYKYHCNKCNWDEGWMEESNLLKGNGCACCDNKIVVQGINDIPTTTPWLVKYFQNPKEAKLYTKLSHKKIYPICPDCGRIKDKLMSISTIYNQRIGCSCEDGMKYPEKLMYNVLEQLNKEFATQLGKTTFEWCNKYKYDFYIPSLNCIIETHGIQHYEQTRRKRAKTLKEEQENDRLKKELALENGIKYYVVIDCRESKLDWIKNNILKSELSKFLNLNNIDWLKAEEFALSNLVKKACEIKRDNPDFTTTDIGKIMNLSRDTVKIYLKKGSKIWNWINYDPKEELRKNGVRNGTKRKINRNIQ